MTNPNTNDDNEDTTTMSNANNNSDSGNRELRETENVLSENGVFALAAMTSAATFPANFKSIEVQKYQIKFKTVNGFEGTIDLHTDEGEARNIREEFQNVRINYVNQDTEHSIPEDSIKYSIRPKKSIPKGGLNKIKRVGESLSQAKYYKNIMPVKIPLRKTDISPADWRVEKYVSWERNKNTDNIVEIDLDENQSDSFSGSIYDDPPDVNVVINGWKRGKSRSTYYFNPPQVPELDQDDQTLLSDYIEYLSEGLKFIQYNDEINRRSELRYCSYLDKAVEIYRQKTQFATPANDILRIFLSESIDNSNKDRVYLFKKKMVGKRLNKIIAQCQLNWHIIDCVEELSTNFLTNTVQEENLNTLIDEINKEYIPKFAQRKGISEIKEIAQRAKARLNKMKNLNLNEIDKQLKVLGETVVLSDVLQQFEVLVNNYEFDIAEDECEFESRNLQTEERDEFINIIDESKEILSRLGTILENAKE